jgi:EmrB/QacA subfamily drug resistance transporter
VTELTRGRRVLVLAICCMSLLIVGLDVTIVNVALPSIQQDLHASVSGLQWTIDAYTLVIASLLMLAGSTGDRVGRRRTFQTGLVVFTFGSLLCSLAPTLPWLVAFRVVQAVGASMLNPVAMSIITNVFTERRERAQAIGVWGGVVGISMSLGPIVGGALVSGIGWRSIFWINIPVGIAAFALTARYVPESRAAHARRVDPVGQVLVIVLLASLVYAIIEGPARGFDSPLIVGLFAVSAASLVLLVAYERRRPEPLIDPRFFRSVPFSAATVIAVCAFAALSGFLFLSTLYLQRVRGLTPLHAGLATLPYAVTTMICAPLSGRIVGTRGTRLPLLLAGIALTASGVMLLRVDAHTPLPWLLTSYALFGLGFGFVNAPITNTAVSGMPRAQAGVAAAVASTSRQVGAALGVAVIGSVVSASVRGDLAVGFVGAARGGWWIIIGCGLVVLVLGYASSGVRARASAVEVASRLAAEDVEPEAAGAR